MTQILHALLAGAIDYAGTYPPASLPLDQAAACYGEYRQQPEAWMLGRFVCPAAKVSELGLWDSHTGDSYNRDRHDRHGPLTVLIPGGDTAETFMQGLDDALATLRKLPAARAIASLELRWPAELLAANDTAALRSLAAAAASRVAAAKLPPLPLYFEFSPARSLLPGDAWHASLRRCVESIAEYNQAHSANQFAAGLKFRTGGIEPGAFPSSAELASLISACRDGGVFWKATAGLHHPLRHFDRGIGTMMHGFVNVLAAAVLADVHCLEAARIQSLLDEEDAGRFRFDDDTLTWSDQSVTSAQIRFARERSLRSFGSCSFDEPRADLRYLGWD